MPRSLVLFALFAAHACGKTNCAGAPSPQVVNVPGHPFRILASRDGCRLFVSIMKQSAEQKSGIAILDRSGATLALSRVAELESQPTGLALTHDGKLLIVAALEKVIVLDVARMTVVASFSTGTKVQSIYVNVSRDDKLLFVSEESAQAITVVDLARVRTKGFDASAILGKIPVGIAPIALTFSPDGRRLYTTSQVARADWNWPKACKPEGRNAKSEITNPEGAVVVIDVALARKDPEHSITAKIPAGCSPVRLAISPRGDRIYVIARNSNSVLAFDTAKLISDPGSARLGMTTVGTAPVPVAVARDFVLVGNSNRFGTGEPASSVSVLDASNTVIKTIPVGSFPRDILVFADGRTFAIANFNSSTVQVSAIE